MKARIAIALMVLLPGVSVAAAADSASSTPTAQESQPAMSALEPITEYRLPAEQLEKARALDHTRMTMFVFDAIYGVVVLLVLLSLRISARFRDWAERASPRRFVQALVFVPLLMLTIDALSLPLSIYGQQLARSYGLSVQGWGSWFWDWTKGELIGTAVATLLIWGLYAILRRSPRRWWLFAWLAWIPVVLLMTFIQPVFIAPLFNEFEPLETTQPQLLPELEKVMHRGGLDIDRSRMFEMRASDKVTTYNAYVTGIGASKRVVVWDNTSRDMTIPETLFVFGHEQGHYVLHHIWLSIAFFIVAMLVALYLAHRSVGAIIARWGARWGVRDISDWASLPVLLLVLSVFSLLGQPLASAVSRHLEHQADIYGLEVIHGLVPDSSQAAAHAFQKLGEKALAVPDPNPLYVMWVSSHPTIADRIAFAARYQPWRDGAPTQYIAP